MREIELEIQGKNFIIKCKDDADFKKKLDYIYLRFKLDYEAPINIVRNDIV